MARPSVREVPAGLNEVTLEHFQEESGFPSENATNAQMLERFLFPATVKPL